MMLGTTFQACRVFFDSLGAFLLKFIKYQLLSKKQGFQRGVTPFGRSFGKRGGMEEREPFYRKKGSLSSMKNLACHFSVHGFVWAVGVGA